MQLPFLRHHRRYDSSPTIKSFLDQFVGHPHREDFSGPEFEGRVVPHYELEEAEGESVEEREWRMEKEFKDRQALKEKK